MKTLLLLVLLTMVVDMEAQSIDTATEWAIKVRCVMKGTETPIANADVQIHLVSNDSLVGGDYTNSNGFTHFMVVKKGDYYVHTSKAHYQSSNTYLMNMWETKTGAMIETIKMEYPPSEPVDSAH